MRVDYSRLAADYDAVRQDDAVDRGFWLPALRQLGRLEAGDRILDLGAGTGRFAKLLAEFARVVALDASPPMLARARGKGSCERVLGDAHRLPFRADIFDATIAVMVLHQLRDCPAALSEVARVSRRIVVATSDMESRDFGILGDAFPNLVRIDRSRFPSIPRIRAALEAAGFREVLVEDRILERVLPVAEQLERVRRKYISTLDLIPPEEFREGLAFLERELPRRYGDAFETRTRFTFLAASR